MDCTSIAGGLYHELSICQRPKSVRYIRPCSIDTNDATFGQAVWVGILDVGDVPPDLLYARKDGRDGGEQGKRGPHDLDLETSCL